MAKKIKQHPPASPAALVSNKRRRLASIDDASPSAPSAPTVTPSGTSAGPAALAAQTVHIVAGSKIQAKVRAVMSALGASNSLESKPPSAADADTTRGDVRPSDASKNLDGVVLVEAHAAGASKLITVVEIAKRTLDNADRPWWAYTGVKGTMEELESRGDVRSSRRQHVHDLNASANELVDGSAGEGDEEEAFEPTGRERTISEKKVRNVAGLFVYLAIKPLPSLKAIHGEQCSEA
ncbi:uncharacterized protein BKCO1_1900037 [Diplodia corticola]|uniref:DNA/RNA-binding protein Alba-like domain-containing protein n=1 Tax=Diplodia corticola TaxID=236234 RepID=A0A1J9R4F1_9PEZI|nr:uncharacterized protein BKCO1_1900037 [Diplodia corticola]OJD35106.1 hypothetical protein BKCO1_1900037 [Diplodia corticola]